jgi:hypothetical protein
MIVTLNVNVKYLMYHLLRLGRLTQSLVAGLATR